MKYLNRILFFFIVATVLFTSACSDDEAGNVDNFDRESMLENIGQNIILPAFEDFETETADLETAVSTLINDVTATNLDAAQQAWLDATLSWKYAEMFMMGPVDQMVLSSSIQNWPTSTAGIEEAIDTTEPINAAYVEGIGSTKKGLPAIEYLLFDFNNGDQAILDLLNNSANRRDYLTALTRRLHTIAAEVNQGWKPDGGNYIATFTGSTRKEGSTNILANEFLMLIERVKNEKLGIPLGKKSMGTQLPENVEARFSGESIKLMLRNIDAIEDVFTGDVNTDQQPGYADYLDALNADYQGELLSTVIQNQLNTLRAEINDINDPLKIALQSQTQEVEEAYTEAQRLVVFTKTDMMSNLGLLVTFDDNDGD